ncbi:MAG TPA: 3-deoxy-8-phosphooctulonate synthase [Chitinophagaceae bacterium]|nr:3-deoxy-8-phosphooctulonate synthase [Chitinophagaceae bacterium]
MQYHGFETLFPEIKNWDDQFVLIAGPCVIEGEKITLEIATQLKKICEELSIPLVFKASYKKGNRTRLDSFTGIGDEEGLEILKKVKDTLGIPVLTDIHESMDAFIAGVYVDVLQIPAFLSRQTDLLVAAAETGRVVNIKKGQFSSPESMQYAVDKVTESDNNQVWLTDRGTFFGYQDLVVDFRGIPKMQAIGQPVFMDCTHSLQVPNQTKGVTGGQPQMIETIARAAIAVGANGLFIETHPNPSEALSDGANMLALSEIKSLLKRLKSLKELINKF